MARIFISYSKTDTGAATAIYRELALHGYSPWIDREDILPGQQWESEIREAIRKAKLVLSCFSKQMMSSRGYVHKEWRMVAEIMQEVPAGQIYVIPVRLDECTVPEQMRGVQWADLFEPRGMQRLLSAVAHALGEPTGGDVAEPDFTIRDASSPMLDFFRALGWEVISHLDKRFWSGDEHAVVVDLDKHWKQSFDHFDDREWEQVIRLWEPLRGNPAFDVRYPRWRIAPAFRCQVQSAKYHLFLAHAELGRRSHATEHWHEAINLLLELVESEPYAMDGPSDSKLPPPAARVQNEEYAASMQLALRWFTSFSPAYVSALAAVPEHIVADLISRVAARLAELDSILAP